MTSTDIERINAGRLNQWRRLLTEVHSTPALLVSFGHDHAAGEVHVVAAEQLGRDVILGMLRFVIREIESGRIMT